MHVAGHRRWNVTQVLVDPQDDNLWALHTEIDLSRPEHLDLPLLRVLRIGP